MILQLLLFLLFPKTVFQASGSQKLTRVALGGQIGGTRERIFTSFGTEVNAYTKKGKNFLTFTTNMSEPIFSL